MTMLKRATPDDADEEQWKRSGACWSRKGRSGLGSLLLTPAGGLHQSGLKTEMHRRRKYASRAELVSRVKESCCQREAAQGSERGTALQSD